jgi:hypothetical protein
MYTANRHKAPAMGWIAGGGNLLDPKLAVLSFFLKRPAFPLSRRSLQVLNLIG